MTKRIIALLLALLFVCSGCAGAEKPKDSPEPTGQESSAEEAEALLTIVLVNEEGELMGSTKLSASGVPGERCAFPAETIRAAVEPLEGSGYTLQTKVEAVEVAYGESELCTYLATCQQAEPEEERVEEPDMPANLFELEEGWPEAVTTGDSMVQISRGQNQEVLYSDDGTELFRRDSLSLAVSIPEHPEVAEAINADLRRVLERDEEIRAQLQGEVKESYAVWLARNRQEDGETAGSWSRWAMGLDVRVARCDDAVLSLVFAGYALKDGVNADHFVIGRSYDLNSGSRLSVDFMSENIGGLFESVRQSLGTQCAQMEEPLVPTEAQLTALMGEEYWFLTDEGMVFLSDGNFPEEGDGRILRFPVSYEELGESMKEVYLLLPEAENEA